jgi:hypothetical protein
MADTVGAQRAVGVMADPPSPAHHGLTLNGPLLSLVLDGGGAAFWLPRSGAARPMGRRPSSTANRSAADGMRYFRTRATIIRRWGGRKPSGLVGDNANQRLCDAQAADAQPAPDVVTSTR